MSSSLRALVFVGAVCALGACAKQESAKPSGTVLVGIVRVPVGGSVLFHNAGRSPHNAVAIDKSWSSEKTFGNIAMNPEDMTEIVFPKQGVYPFYCTYHGSPDAKVGMVGTVVVGDVAYTPTKADGSGAKPVDTASGVVRRVPQDYPSIQVAVDAAAPGDLILVDRGVYTEAVFVVTPSLTLRGVDRNAVILDGQFSLGTGIMVGANGVAIENMTARNYTLNGFYWTGVTGYRGSYLTAYDNGDYGIYSFGATDGVFEHSYASGSPDSAFYVGQCFPCRTILNDVVGELSGLGYSGTNSGGDMYIVNSRFTRNRTGVSTTTFDIELLPPGRDSVIMGNFIADNGRSDEATGFYATETLAGYGIALAGTHRNRVERNRIVDNTNSGIVIMPLNDRHFWPSTGHRVRDNIVLGNRHADLQTSGFGTIDNCFEGNHFHTSLPWGLQSLNGCDAARVPLASDLSGYFGFLANIAKVRAGDFTTTDFRNRPAPPPQPNMPGGADAPVIPASHPFEDFHLDLSAIKTPAAPAGRSN
jgi:Right handed beta helix region